MEADSLRFMGFRRTVAKRNLPRVGAGQVSQFSSLVRRPTTTKLSGMRGTRVRRLCPIRSISYVDLAGGLSKLAPPLARLSLMHRAIRLRSRHGVRREESHVRQQARVSGEVLLSAEAQYAAGETLRTIATEVGVSRQRLASLLRERGVRLRRTAPSDAEVQEMVRRYADGESLERVGARVGFSAGTVRNHLIVAGVLLRDPQGRER